jgi:hypothetical protein
MHACLRNGDCSPIGAPSGLVEELGDLGCLAAARLAYDNGNRIFFYHVQKALTVAGDGQQGRGLVDGRDEAGRIVIHGQPLEFYTISIFDIMFLEVDKQLEEADARHQVVTRHTAARHTGTFKAVQESGSLAPIPPSPPSFYYASSRPSFI